jgi:hypothetical protein
MRFPGQREKPLWGTDLPGPVVRRPLRADMPNGLSELTGASARFVCNTVALSPHDRRRLILYDAGRSAILFHRLSGLHLDSCQRATKSVRLAGMGDITDQIFVRML